MQAPDNRRVDHPVVTSLLPVVLLIVSGFMAKRWGWVGAGSTKDLSNLVFCLLSPALLFRSMSAVHVEDISLAPVGAYFLGSGVIFAGTLLAGGFNPRTAVLALANTFSNTVMIGIPLVSLAYGPEGMVTLLTLVSLHALVILTAATVALELAVAKQQAPDLASRPSMVRAVLTAARNAVIHPVPLPIIAGLLWAQTGWTIPAVVDRPIQLLGQAFGPMALVMVGITLAGTPVGRYWREAIQVSLVKTLVQPALVAAIAWCMGLRGLPYTVIVVASSLPIGANVFLFSQRYRVAEPLITASVAVSTVLALATVSLVMALMAWLV